LPGRIRLELWALERDDWREAMPGNPATDPCDFETLYADFYPRVVRYLTRLAGPDGAEDLAQEVFIKIHRSLGEFRGDSSLSTWVYRVATNAAMDKLRSAERRSSASACSSSEVEELVVPDRAASPERQAIRIEMSACVQELVKELPEAHRTVLILSETEGFRNAEIAEVLDVSLETVKIRLHRARAQLRKRMNEQCRFYRDRESILLCDRKVAPPNS